MHPPLYAYKCNKCNEKQNLEFTRHINILERKNKELIELSKFIQDKLTNEMECNKDRECKDYIIVGSLINKIGNILSNYLRHPNKDVDWPEDFWQENGNYENICIKCNHPFIGHKRRVICKECSNKNKDNK